MATRRDDDPMRSIVDCRVSSFSFEIWESRRAEYRRERDKRRQYVLQQCWMILSVFVVRSFSTFSFLDYPISFTAFFQAVDLSFFFHSSI
jgi:hypothetical protein